MKHSFAATTAAIALTGAFVANAADAHDWHHEHYYRHEGPVYVVPGYIPPPPVYYAPVVPVAPVVGSCTPRFNRYGAEIGSVRQNADPYTGQLSRPYYSPTPCY